MRPVFWCPMPRALQLFSAFCNLCPSKHCGIEKYMGAAGNIICRRLSEISTEIEIAAEGGIVARIPVQEIGGA